MYWFQGYLILHVLALCVWQDFPVHFLDTPFAFKDNWLLHVLLYCVEQDVPFRLHGGCIALPKREFATFMYCHFKLLDDHLVRKNIWLLHVQAQANCNFCIATVTIFSHRKDPRIKNLFGKKPEGRPLPSPVSTFYQKPMKIAQIRWKLHEPPL